jgi:hypothetical protein
MPNARANSLFSMLLAVSATASCGRPLPNSELPSRPQTTVADTSRPLVPDGWHEKLDRDLTVPWPTAPKYRYYRNRFLVAFDSSTSGVVIRRFLGRYRAEIVGGLPALADWRTYVIKVPDPGPDVVTWQALYERMGSEPSVRLATPLDSGNVPLDPYR